VTAPSRLADVFDRCHAEGRAALLGYLPVGFPTVPDSIAALRAMAAGGVDVIEIGVAYSDPLMDGPVIQHAVQHALIGGVTTKDVLTAVAAVSDAGVPAVVMTYWNPIERYGPEMFATDLASAGGTGVIVPDLIPEEAAPWITAADSHGLDRIFLVAPSSTDARLAVTVDHCRGFVYAASTMGVTGVRSQVDDAARTLVSRARAHTDLPVCLGLGVSTPAHATEIADFADGVIVGSAFVRRLTEAPDPAAGLRSVTRLVAELAAGVRGAPV
jgi:tryptophan synthase alpha chain